MHIIYKKLKWTTICFDKRLRQGQTRKTAQRKNWQPSNLKKAGGGSTKQQQELVKLFEKTCS